MKARSSPEARLLLPVLLAAALAACSVKAPVYGLRPEYPEVRRHGTEVLFARVDSTRPMLRWESYSPHDDVKWVVYDLKIYRSENDSPGRLLEEKSGLAEPHYQFQQELGPCSKYFWSVRARFRIAGREEATEWGAVQIPGRDRWVPVVPDPAYYRFQVPCGKDRT